MSKIIFVFGSNESGIHGAGAAKVAMLTHGAVYGVGYGLQGQSFAIPTKDWEILAMKREVIETYVKRFLAFAAYRPKLTFQITKIGCGLGGWTDKDIAPMFIDAPANCHFDTGWKPFLGEEKSYWGSFG